MRCTEYFYNEEKAIDFMESVDMELEPEIIKTMDEDINEEVWVVYFNPPKM